MTHQITASLVSSKNLNSFLTKHLDDFSFLFNINLSSALENMCEDYKFTNWQYYSLSNGGLYAAPTPVTEGQLINISVKGNGYQGLLSPDAAGIVVSLYILNALSWRTEKDSIIELFYLLREYALDHKEMSSIFSAID